MKIAVYGQNYQNESNLKAFEILVNCLTNYKTQVFVESKFLEIQKETYHNDWSFGIFKELDNSYDLFISIGGDGTILRAITYVRDLDIPIVGINTGRLGFWQPYKPMKLKMLFLTFLIINIKFLTEPWFLLMSLQKTS